MPRDYYRDNEKINVMAHNSQGTWACNFPLIQTIINFSMERKKKKTLSKNWLSQCKREI